MIVLVNWIEPIVATIILTHAQIIHMLVTLLGLLEEHYEKYMD